ncbi:MAG TPA: hypothetical protein VF179_05635, partial [Thermoanaerobaculia bacterium]|nr:hypothetical protein [Thermoanaerobaculia bacterium]
MRRVVAAGVALFLLSSVAFADEQTDRLARVGKLWGTVRYLHPYLAYKEIDWDAALVTALPRVREARTPEEYRAAVQGMLDALGDPVTRVADPPPPPGEQPAAAQPVALSRKLDGGVLVIELAKYLKTASPRAARGAIAALHEEIAKASALVVDLRAGKLAGAEAFYAGYFLEQLGDALVNRPSRAPSQRYLMH